jgi:hypothetical protein
VFHAALQEKEVHEKLSGMGFEVAGGPAEQLAELMRSESRKWGQVVAAAQVKID